jgi:hypothetical protein
MNTTADKCGRQERLTISNGEPRFIELLLAEQREGVCPVNRGQYSLNEVAATTNKVRTK